MAAAADGLGLELGLGLGLGCGNFLLVRSVRSVRLVRYFVAFSQKNITHFVNVRELERMARNTK